MRKRLVVTFALVTTAAVFVACGDDNGGGNGGVEADGSDTPVELSGEVTNKGTEDVTNSTELEVEADDFYFEPTFVKATPGSTITVTITNEGDANHTFTIDDARIDNEIAPAGNAEASVTVPDDGIVNFYCRFHRSQGMQGAMFTRSGQSSGGAPATSAPAGGDVPGPGY
jgi:plastocyanin